MRQPTFDLFDLTGKTAVVTGASRGIGKSIALGLADAGADIVAIASKVENVADTGKKIEALGRRVLPLACDQSSGKAIKDTVEQVLRETDAIDILVNNAGILGRAPAREFSDEDWERVIDTNLTGVFKFCRAVGGHMIDRGAGKIINIASLLSFQGGITVPAYAASKGGVATLTKALSNEWAVHNVQVNAIAPGYIATDINQALRDDDVRDAAITERIPAGHWGEPEDLAGAAIFLASRASDYVSGHILTVDGGWMGR